MTPGDKSPGRYRKTTLSVAVAGLIAASASSSDILNQFLDEREGNRYHSYQDGVHKWTACRGVTRFGGKAIGPNMTFTKAECDEMNKTEAGRAFEIVDRLVTVPLSPPARAGIASFCGYNLGETKCRQSTFLTLLNAGRRNEACAQVTLWIRDKGKDCRLKESNCSGQVARRPQEDELCLITTGEPQP